MINCDQQKYNCGQVLPSACIPYTGSGLTCIADPTLLACNANMNDVIGLIDGVVKKLVDGDNLTGLNPQCLIFNPATITPAALHQIEINKICGLDASLTALTTQVNNLNVGTLLITIDMQCLTAAVSACVTPTDTYPLVAVLNAMLSEICALKTAVGI
jgi:hypothetical protein